MKNQIVLRAINEQDLPLIEKWLYKPYILKWYEDPVSWLDEMKGRNDKFKFIKHFIVLFGDVPMGFCQFYDCYDAKEDWYEVKNKGEVFSVDYLIGQEEFLSKGFGKLILKNLIEKIKVFPNANLVIVQPEKENLPSCNLLLSCGFVFNKQKKYFELNL